MADVAVGVVGTGFIARNLVTEVSRRDGYRVTRVLTRRPVADLAGFPDRVDTKSIDELVSHCDVVVECSGDPAWAYRVVTHAVDAGVPVVTMNTEFHITFGSALVGRGLVTEAAGDQPGCLAELHEEAVAMGFAPVAYGNMKGFFNPDPSRDDMEYWADRQGISVPMTTSFTDGTKVQAEQVLVANHFGATIAGEGMLGPSVEDQDEATRILAKAYEDTGRPISDFVVSPNLSHGVFIVATHHDEQKDALAYYKLGPGPYYTIVRPNIFVHLEILKTVRRVLDTGQVLLDNGETPELSLAAVAKRDLPEGLSIKKGIGSFDVRGHAVRIGDHADHVPIGLLDDATLTEPVGAGEILRFSQVELARAGVTAWNSILGRVLDEPRG